MFWTGRPPQPVADRSGGPGPGCLNPTHRFLIGGCCSIRPSSTVRATGRGKVAHPTDPNSIPGRGRPGGALWAMHGKALHQTPNQSQKRKPRVIIRIGGVYIVAHALAGTGWVGMRCGQEGWPATERTVGEKEAGWGCQMIEERQKPKLRNRNNTASLDLAPEKGEIWLAAWNIRCPPLCSEQRA